MKLTDSITISVGELINYIYLKSDEVLGQQNKESGDCSYQLGERNGIISLRKLIMHDLLDDDPDIMEKK